MSDETANPEEEEEIVRQAQIDTRLKRLPDWFQKQYGKTLDSHETEIDPVTGLRVKVRQTDPRHIGPAAQQEKKPL